MIFKKAIIPFALFSLISAGNTFAAANPQTPSTGLEYEVLTQWQLPEKPVDIVHSLDGKYVFILSSDSKVLIYSAQGKLEGSVPVDKGVNAIDIAPRAEMLYLIDGEKKSFTTMSINFIQNINISGSPFKGPEDAPVTLVLFTDFECPYCRKLEPLIAQVLERNPKKVKLVFKNMPLQFHKFADPAARAALAAREQGKFWEFHDEIFRVQKLDDKTVEETAKKLELNYDKLQNDMKSPEISRQINVDLQDAQKAGVTGTPTVFINGRLLKNRSLQGFQQMIDEEAKK